MKEGTPPRVRGKKPIRDHRDLRVWRKATQVAELAGAACQDFPEAPSRLAQTIPALAGAVADEIAAGQSRGQYPHYVEHLEHARSAAHRLEDKLIEAHKAGLLTAAVGDPLLAKIGEILRMLGKLLVSLEIAHGRRRASASGY